MSGKALSVLLKQRTSKRSSTTRTINNINQNFPDDNTDASFYIAKLTDLRACLNSLDGSIHSIVLEDDFEGDFDYNDDYDKCEQYIDNINKFLSRLNASLNDNSHVSANNRASIVSNKLKLPQVELPTFSGVPEEYTRFVETFEAIIGKFNLTQFEKFSYLLQQTSGPAREIINCVPHTGKCYDAALEILKDAFSNLVVQQFSVIKKLVNLKLVDESNFHSWISEVRVLADQIQNLNIDSDIFAQYFVWNSLSKKYRDVFISHINKCNPDLDEIIDNSFAVANRIFEGSKCSVENSDHKFAMATNISKPSMSGNLGCQLCRDITDGNSFSHKIYNCPEYDSPQSKLNRIKELNGCTKCGLINHSIGNCRFKFASKCRTCSSWHASFLCIESLSNDGNRSKTKNRGGNRKTSSDSSNVRKETNVIKFDVMNTKINDKIIVPTFTVPLAKKSKKNKGKMNIRALYDPASQVTFISEKFVNNIEHKLVKDNVDIQITGFNESKSLTTRIIECSFDVLNRTRHFQAVVVPEIKSRIPVSSLQFIRKTFIDNSIPLADKQLFKENDGSVGILFGVDYAHVLPVQSCSFGNQNKSLIFHTGLGVMLAGNLNDLNNNMSCVLSVKSFVDSVRNNK